MRLRHHDDAATAKGGLDRRTATITRSDVAFHAPLVLAVFHNDVDGSRGRRSAQTSPNGKAAPPPIPGKRSPFWKESPAMEGTRRRGGSKYPADAPFVFANRDARRRTTREGAREVDRNDPLPGRRPRRWLGATTKVQGSQRRTDDVLSTGTSQVGEAQHTQQHRTIA